MKLLKTTDFGNARSKYRLVFLGEDNEVLSAEWAWPVLEKDVTDFLKVYNDKEWKEVEPTSFVYAVDFEQIDRMVCEGAEDGVIGYLELEVLAEKHALEKKGSPRSFSSSLFFDDTGLVPADPLPYFENPFAALIFEEAPVEYSCWLVPADSEHKSPAQKGTWVMLEIK